MVSIYVDKKRVVFLKLKIWDPFNCQNSGYPIVQVLFMAYNFFVEI